MEHGPGRSGLRPALYRLQVESENVNAGRAGCHVPQLAAGIWRGNYPVCPASACRDFAAISRNCAAKVFKGQRSFRGCAWDNSQSVSNVRERTIRKEEEAKQRSTP